MALINTLNDIGNAIREKTGGTELIPLKEMASAIQGISSGGGAELDHTVTFMVDGQPYEIVSVKDGNSVSKPLTDPTSESGSFGGWKIDGNGVTFPYLPTDDTDITALFQNIRSEIELHNANDIWFVDNKSTWVKSYDGLAVVGWYLWNDYYNFLIVGKTSKSCATTGISGGREFTYNGETWYYATMERSKNSYTITNYGNCVQLANYSGTAHDEKARELLDYYFMVE